MTKLYGLFLDDSKPFSIPAELEDKDIEWTHFVSAREFLQSDYLRETFPSFVVFDYYMEDGLTGRDLIFEIVSYAKTNNLAFPYPYFNSSDASCNDKMRLLWLKLTNMNIEDPATKKPAEVKPAVIKKKVTGVAAHFRRNRK